MLLGCSMPMIATLIRKCVANAWFYHILPLPSSSSWLVGSNADASPFLNDSSKWALNKLLVHTWNWRGKWSKTGQLGWTNPISMAENFPWDLPWMSLKSESLPENIWTCHCRFCIMGSRCFYFFSRDPKGNHSSYDHGGFHYQWLGICWKFWACWDCWIFVGCSNDQTWDLRWNQGERETNPTMHVDPGYVKGLKT